MLLDFQGFQPRLLLVVRFLDACQGLWGRAGASIDMGIAMARELAGLVKEGWDSCK
jgi:hypothetical protein